MHGRAVEQRKWVVEEEEKQERVEADARQLLGLLTRWQDKVKGTMGN